MADNPVKYEKLITQYLRSILDTSVAHICNNIRSINNNNNIRSQNKQTNKQILACEIMNIV